MILTVILYKDRKMALFTDEKNEAKTDNMPNPMPLVKQREKAEIQNYPGFAFFPLKYATTASTFMTLRPYEAIRVLINYLCFKK